MTSETRATRSTVMPALRYQDAPAAMDWLCGVLGFQRHNLFPGPDGGIAHAELTLHGGMVMLGSKRDDEHARRFQSPAELGQCETSSIYIIVPDADQAYARAQAAGAAISRQIADTHYGSREFEVRDPEGHTWTVGSYDPWAHEPQA